MDEFWNQLDRLVSWGTTVGAWILAAGGFVAVGWRRIKSVVRAIGLSDRLHSHFGSSDPAESIASAIKLLRHATSENEIRAQIISAHLGLALYVTDHEGRCTYGNEICADLFECDQNDLIGSGWLRYVAEEQRRNVWEDWQYAVKHGTPYNAHFEIVTDSGRKWIHSVAYAVTVDNVVICYVGYCKRVEPKDGIKATRDQ